MGLNTLSSENKLFPDNLKIWSSRFWEYGYTLNARLSNQPNLLHIKHGVSLIYNNLRPLFENNIKDEHNFSLGLRWDIN